MGKKNVVGDVEIFSRNEELVGRIQKMSLQTKESTGKGVTKYVNPRYAFDDLMYFFELNTWHQRCIRLKAATSVGLGCDIIGEDGKVIQPGEEPEDEGYRAMVQLLKQPNREYRFSSLAVREVIDYLGTGNLFLEVVRNGRGIPAELYHARVKNMRVGYDLLYCYQVVNGAVTATFRIFGEEAAVEGESEMIFYHNYDPRSDFYGMPEWLPAMTAALLDRSAAEFNIRMFENDMMMKWLIFLVGAELSESAKEKMKSFFEGNYSGVKNAGRAAIVPIESGGENVKIEAKNLMGDGQNRDASYIQMREQARDEIIAAHGVPPRLVGVMAAGQLGGGGELESQLMCFKETVVMPLKEDIEECLNIIPLVMGWRYRFQFREFDITTTAEDRSVWGVLPGLVAEGIIDIETARALVDIRKEMRRKKVVPVEKGDDATMKLARALMEFRKEMRKEKKGEK